MNEFDKTKQLSLKKLEMTKNKTNDKEYRYTRTSSLPNIKTQYINDYPVLTHDTLYYNEYV